MYGFMVWCVRGRAWLRAIRKKEKRDINGVRMLHEQYWWTVPQNRKDRIEGGNWELRKHCSVYLESLGWCPISYLPSWHILERKSGNLRIESVWITTPCLMQCIWKEWNHCTFNGKEFPLLHLKFIFLNYQFLHSFQDCFHELLRWFTFQLLSLYCFFCSSVLIFYFTAHVLR